MWSSVPYAFPGGHFLVHLECNASTSEFVPAGNLGFYSGTKRIHFHSLNANSMYNECKWLYFGCNMSSFVFLGISNGLENIWSANEYICSANRCISNKYIESADGCISSVNKSFRVNFVCNCVSPKHSFRNQLKKYSNHPEILSGKSPLAWKRIRIAYALSPLYILYILWSQWWFQAIAHHKIKQQPN